MYKKSEKILFDKEHKEEMEIKWLKILHELDTNLMYSVHHFKFINWKVVLAVGINKHKNELVKSILDMRM